MNPKLVELLAREGVEFEVIPHRTVFTAQERAAASHVPGRRLAKVVVIADGEWVGLAVIPATARLDLAVLRQVARRPGVRLADEGDFALLFSDCDRGARPPFGRLYGGLPVYLDRALCEEDALVFEGGTHREEVRIPMADYLRIERPAVASLSVEARAA